jgi:hypothetical protein
LRQRIILTFSYGVYDGNLARGKQTGTEGPEFNWYYFNIGEVGAALGDRERQFAGLIWHRVMEPHGVRSEQQSSTDCRDNGKKASSIASSDSFTLSSARLNKPRGLDIR